MKKINKNSIITAVAITMALVGPMATFAATDPGLGTASSFSVLGQTSITNVPTSSISGNVGLNNAGTNYSGLTSAEVAGTIYDTNGTGPDGAPGNNPTLTASATADASTAKTNMAGQSLTSNQGPALDGLTLTTGVYDIGAGQLNGGVLTLDGPGVYIFRASSSFISSGSINLINGARACDVYWSVNTLATINGSSFVGTIIAGTGVHFGANVALDGRALAIGGDVTMISNTISGPGCVTPTPPPPPPAPGGSSSGSSYLNVVKVVVNDSGGTKTIADFPLFIDGAQVQSGISVQFPSNSYHLVSETSSAQYTRTISGDCDASGSVNVGSGQNKFCIITNNDIGAPVVPVIPPIIDLVKTANPLSLPNGPGSVVYTYSLSNIGTVPVNNVTIVGDTCNPVVRVSGDSDNDNVLDLNEVWVHTCSTTLTETHTNTAVATGWANGISATDIASATVVVGQPIVPPLIHVTKVPNPLALSAVGGLVNYTKRITNPGIVALSNVTISDDKCSPVNYVAGDLNGDAKLDTNETWIYNCRANLYQTTTNTVVVTGQANGLTARDFAIVTVVVAAPSFPNTGLPPNSDFGQMVKAIATNLTKGSTGNNVEALQQFLISQDKGPAAKSLAQVGATAYFGVLTKAALAEFQAKAGISPAYGYFGPITRGYLKANY